MHHLSPKKEIYLLCTGSSEFLIARPIEPPDQRCYLNRIALDLVHVPDECRKAVEEAIAAIRAEGISKYDWRD
ncbi:hypothetical protein ACTJKF_30455 [Burkholderia sp. 22313]